MKFAWVALLVLPAAAWADRIILAPTATKLREGTFRYEAMALQSVDGTMGWLGLGLGQAFEFELTGENFDSPDLQASFNFSYQYLAPLTDISPGLSVGLVDGLNQTRDGRMVYLAATWRLGNLGDLNQNLPTEFTLGLSSRERGLAFGGASLPVAEWLRLVAEHDGIRPTAGLDFRPFPGTSLRFLFRADENPISLRVNLRF